jgi:hypothetical protein
MRDSSFVSVYRSLRVRYVMGDTRDNTFDYRRYSTNPFTPTIKIST